MHRIASKTQTARDRVSRPLEFRVFRIPPSESPLLDAPHVPILHQNRKLIPRHPLRSRSCETIVVTFEDKDIEKVLATLDGLLYSGKRYHIVLLSPFLKHIGLNDAAHRLKYIGRFSFVLDRQTHAATNHWIRIWDLALVIPMMLVWLPFHLILSALIFLTSPGKPLFASQRIGYHEEPFIMYKYRTMGMKNDDQSHRDFLESLYADQERSTLSDNDITVLKMDNDPRVTMLGKVLRKLSIDEVAQFWNVLRGEMSLIGPRPCLDYERDQMEGWHRNRFLHKPGISGLWQIFGRSRVSISQSHFLDSLMIYAQSVPFYLKLVIRTPLVVISGKGAC